MSRDHLRQRSGRTLFAGTLLALLTLIVSGGCGGGSPTTAPTARLPSDFLGVVSNDAFAARGAARAQIFAGERRTGVELVRQTFDWSVLEPRPGHFDFSTYDAYMAASARAGLQVLPVLFGRPSYEPAQRPRGGGAVTATTTFAPARLADFASFTAALARRYGPDGTFWRAHPQLDPRPIRSWQIWNEPNLPVYWGGRPDAAGYVALLTASARALRAVDPGAEIVTAGLPDSTIGVNLERYLREMLAHGARGSFDTLAIDPYASSDAGVLAATRQVRRVLDQAGLRRTAIWVTEIGWASGGPGSSFTVGARAQARDVLGALTALGSLARTLRIRGVVYFAWRDAPPYAGGSDFWGLHTGLLAQNGSGKPALSAYYQAAGVLGTLPHTPSG
jgi:hypothetical protein